MAIKFDRFGNNRTVTKANPLYSDPIAILQALGYQKPKQKVGVLERIAALLNVAQTAPAVYKGLQTGNPLAALGEYGRTAGQGIATAITGERQSDEKLKTYKDVLTDFAGMKDRPGKIDPVDVLGFAGDVALDPTTYLGVGTAGKLTKAGRVAQQAAIKEGVAKGLNREAIDVAAKNAVEGLGKEGVQIANQLRFAGKNTPINLGKLGKPVKALVDPVETAMPFIKNARTSIAGAFGLGAKTEAEKIAQAGTRGLSGAALSANISAKEIQKIVGKIPEETQLDFITRVQQRTGVNPEWGDNLRKAYEKFTGMSEQTTAARRVLGLSTQEDLGYVPKINVDKQGVKPNIPGGARQLKTNLQGAKTTIKGFTEEGMPDTQKAIGTMEQQGMRPRELLINATGRKAKKVESRFNRNIGKLETKLNNLNKTALDVSLGRQAKETTLIDDAIATLNERLNDLKNRLAYRQNVILPGYGSKRTAAQQVAGKQKGIMTTLKELAQTGGKMPENMAERIAQSKTATEVPTAAGLLTKTKEGLKNYNLVAPNTPSSSPLKSIDPTMIEDDVQKEIAQLKRDIQITRADLVAATEGRLQSARLKKIVEGGQLEKSSILNQLKSKIGTTENNIVKVQKLKQERLAPLQELITKLESDPSLVFKGSILKPTLYNMGDITIKEARDVGINFSTDLGQVTEKMMNDHFKNLQMQETFTQFANEVGSDAPLDDTYKTFGELISSDQAKKMGNVFNVIKDKYFSPEDIAVMNKHYKTFTNDDATKGLLKTIGDVNNWFKKAVTAVFPSFHVRNMATNTANIFTALDLNPIDTVTAHKDAIGFMKDFAIPRLNGASIENLADKKVGNLGLTYSQLFDEMVNQNLFRTGYAKETMGVTNKLGELVGKASSPLKKVQNAAGTVGNLIEDSGKTALFIGRLKKGDTVEQAADQVRKWLFDYADLTDFEKNVMKNVMPFYTWMKKNVELQLTEMAHNPGRYATLFKGMERLSNREGTNTDDLPDWLKQGFEFPLGTKDGQAKYITGLGTPLEALETPLSGKGLMSALTPMLKAPIELTTGKNIFKGVDIASDTSGNDYRNAPQWAKDLLGVKENRQADGTVRYTMPTGVKYALSVLPLTARSVPTIMKVFNISQGEAQDLLPILTGAKTYSINVADQAERTKKDKEEAAWKKLQSMGIGATYTKQYIPKASRASLAQQFTR